MDFPQTKLQELWDKTEVQAGTLYVVGTPIGNAGDISVRALATLAKADTVLAEDTRTSAELLSPFGVKPFYLSFHDHNYAGRIPQVLELLKGGNSVAQISDAGMPGVSDPGAELVDACLEAGIPVKVVPGPSASTAIISLSGLDSSDFRFIGFIPIKEKDRQSCFESIRNYAGLNIIYEAPHRLVETLEAMAEAGFGQRRLVVGRELTKRYEEVFRDTLDNVIDHFRQVKPRGEFVLVLDQASELELKEAHAEAVDNLETVIRARLQAGASQKTIVQELSENISLSKNELKKLIQSISQED